MNNGAHSSDEWVQQVYDELRRIAAWRLSRERPGSTLQVTALVHDAYLRIRDSQGPVARAQFFDAAAEAMRRILIERARQKRSLKHGGGRQRVRLDDVAASPGKSSEEDLLAIDEALTRLESRHPRKARLVRLRYFAGLTIREAAEALGVAESTADADWAYARSWIRLELGNPE